tara:strand:- start:7836 stop:8549 length:714 start_codon:yes stop_codon:yes gene_type:complete
MSKSLANEFISQGYTSLLHLSGGDLNKLPARRDVYDGAGNITGIALSGTKVIVNNVELPEQHSESAEYKKKSTSGVTSLINMLFPVDSIQLTFNGGKSGDPGKRLPGTTWELASQGRFIVGVGGSNPHDANESYVPGTNKGVSTFSLTKEQMPAHTHTPAGTNDQFDNVVTWSGKTDANPSGEGPIDKLIPVGTLEEPVYGFPFSQPIAQKLSTEGDGDPINVTPPAYGVYVWRRIE